MREDFQLKELHPIVDDSNGKDTQSGTRFELRVLEWLRKNFPTIKFKHQFKCGETPYGTHRRIDIAAIREGRILVAIECKFQENSGTTDDKIPAAVDDLNKLRTASNGQIGILLIYQGDGWKDTGRTFGGIDCAFEFVPGDVRKQRILYDEFCLAAGLHEYLVPEMDLGFE